MSLYKTLSPILYPTRVAIGRVLRWFIEGVEIEENNRAWEARRKAVAEHYKRFAEKT